ncbi:hypothetical protein LSAT2_021409 [Lamellibrachia satsuma]|nr:hypothetical protein LSAT2_021409 [Lamellibrachia satsuma]
MIMFVGCTALDIIQGIESLTEGYIRGVFFHFYPARDISLLEWLAQWMRKGAVPLLTLNLQKAVPLGYPIPDAWHHQMVYGVDQKGVYLTNPLNVVAEADIQQQLCSDSVLLVRRNDVISHWTDSCDLTVLIRQRDPRWRTMNVLGQVVNVLREDRMSLVTGFRPQLTTHVQIPAWYSAGVTLFTRRDSDAHCQLRTTSSELPLVQPPDQ